MVIKSPIDGVVDKIKLSEGSLTKQGEEILSIVDPSKIRIILELPASDLLGINKKSIGILTHSSSKEKFKVKVKGISPTVDQTTGTATVVLELQDIKKAKMVPIGTIAKVQFKAGIHQGLLAPEIAVNYKGKDPYVRVIEDKKVKTINVELGSRKSGNVEIIKGLGPGDKVIVRSSDYVAEGEEVEVQK